MEKITKQALQNERFKHKITTTNYYKEYISWVYLFSTHSNCEAENYYILNIII